MNPAQLALVDDDPAFAEYLTTLLGSRGYDVTRYASGADLLQALGRNPAPDVVLLDVLMPGMLNARGNHDVHALLTPLVSHADLRGSVSPGDGWNLVRFWTMLWSRLG